MLGLTDDCLTYLFHVSYPFLKDITYLFITCHKLNTISNICINNILKKNYKLLIRNDYLKTPKQTYGSISRIYGEKFVMCKSKLCDLAVQSVLTNNTELLNLLHKNASNTIKSKESTMVLYQSALDIKSLEIINCLLEHYPVLQKELFEKIIDYYYFNKINSPIILKNIIDKNIDHKDIIICKSLVCDDLDTLKFFIDDENANDLLTRAIKISNIKAAIYIIQHFKYDENILKILIENRREYTYMTQQIVDALNFN